VQTSNSTTTTTATSTSHSRSPSTKHRQTANARQCHVLDNLGGQLLLPALIINNHVALGQPLLRLPAIHIQLPRIQLLVDQTTPLGPAHMLLLINDRQRLLHINMWPPPRCGSTHKQQRRPKQKPKGQRPKSPHLLEQKRKKLLLALAGEIQNVERWRCSVLWKNLFNFKINANCG
jgi:hypothetical protein